MNLKLLCLKSQIGIPHIIIGSNKCVRRTLVREISKNGERFYVCEACGIIYKEKSWATKCEDYCTKHGACSLEIISHAVN